MKKYYFLIIVALILGLVLTGCSLLSNISQVPATDQSGIAYLTKGGPSEIPLYAGQDIPVGIVTISNDDTNLYVTYNTTGGWVMTETHLAVVTEKDDFPTNKAGNPQVGQFPYGEENIFTETWEEIIKLADIPAVAGETLYIAAHAVVEEVTCFDGTSGLTVEGTENLDIDGSITVEALVKVEASVDNKFYTIVGKWNDRDGDDRAWLLGIYNLLPCFYISTNGTNFPRAIVDLGNELHIGQWYHLKGTFDEVTGEIKIYVDDILENTNDTSFGNININVEPVLVGGDRAGGPKGAFFNGCIDEVNVWDGIGEGATLVLEWPETPVTESAWAFGNRFTEQGNWATYFTYYVELPPVCSLSIEGNTQDISWGFRNTDVDLFPNEIPITFTGTVNAEGLQDNGAVLIGLLDKKYVDESSSGYMGGAYAYFGRIGNNLRVGPTDGNFGGEIVQVFKTFTDYFSSPMDIYFTMVLHANSISITVNGDVYTDSYGEIKAQNSKVAYAWDEFEHGAYVGIDSWPYDEYGINDMTYNVTIDWCTE